MRAQPRSRGVASRERYLSAGDVAEGAQGGCRLELPAGRIEALESGETKDAVAFLVGRRPRVPVGALTRVRLAQEPERLGQAAGHSTVGGRQRLEPLRR